MIAILSVPVWACLGWMGVPIPDFTWPFRILEKCGGCELSNREYFRVSERCGHCGRTCFLLLGAGIKE